VFRAGRVDASAWRMGCAFASAAVPLVRCRGWAMSSDVAGPVPRDAGCLVMPGADSPHGAGGERQLRFTRAVVRVAAHVAAWTPFVVGPVRAVKSGWRPVSDSAVIALRSWDALSANGMMVGEATRLGHGVYGLGPLEFWLLALPVHLDPVPGVLWGAAVWCMVAASLAIEAAWSAAGAPGGVLAGGVILGVVAWIPKIAMLPAWNPWFGMMFFIAALAAGCAVLSGRGRWWPVLVVTGSVAAQAHLMYAIAAAGLVLAGFITVIADSLRERRSRWLIAGIVAGLACWAAPLIQQFTARVGNMTQLISTVRAEDTGRAGLAFGLKAISAATRPPAYWWQPSLPLKLSVLDQRAAWFGAVQLAVAALGLIGVVLALRSRRAAALAVVTVLAIAAMLDAYAGIPAADVNPARNPVTDLSYLMAPIFPLGVLAWLTAGAVLALAIRTPVSWLAARMTARRPVSGRVRAAGRIVAPWALRITALAAVALMATLTSRAVKPIGGDLPNQRSARRAVIVASAQIEREVSPGRITLMVVAPNTSYRRQVTMGLAYALRTVGYTPQISTWAFQIGPAYRDAGNPVIRTTVFAVGQGAQTRVKIISRSAFCRERRCFVILSGLAEATAVC